MVPRQELISQLESKDIPMLRLAVKKLSTKLGDLKTQIRNVSLIHRCA